MLARAPGDSGILLPFLLCCRRTFWVGLIRGIETTLIDEFYRGLNCTKERKPSNVPLS